MKNIASLVYFAVLFGGAMPAHADENSIKQASFLKGCWTLKETDKTVTEDWSALTATQMHGSSKTIVKGKVVQEESIEIRWDEKIRKVVYIPTLNRKLLNTFTLDQTQSNAEHKVVFVDPNNKTLKKLVYTLMSKSILNVRLLGNEKDGQPFDFDYNMTQDICPRTATP